MCIEEGVRHGCRGGFSKPYLFLKCPSSVGRREPSGPGTSLVSGQPEAEGMYGVWARRGPGEQAESQGEALPVLMSVLGEQPMCWAGAALTWTPASCSIIRITGEEELLSRKMRKYWANFARNG